MLELNLSNIVEVSKVAIDTISHLKDKELLVVVGNTGCGKSTMISSLAFGPQMHRLASVKLDKQGSSSSSKTFY